MPTFIMKNSIADLYNKVIDLNSDTHKCALLGTLLSDKNTATYGYSENTGSELASGGGYTTGGKTLTTPTIGVDTDFAYFDADDPSWTSATLTGVKGAMIYDDTVTTPKADPILVAQDFGNPSGYSVTAGNLTVTFALPSAGGVFRFTV